MNEDALHNLYKKFELFPEFLGVTITAPDQVGNFGDTLLHMVCRRGESEHVRLLIESGVCVNLPGDLGYTPLHCAAMKGHLDIMAFLISRGANPALTNEFGETPLDVATQLHNKPAITFLRDVTKARQN